MSAKHLIIATIRPWNIARAEAWQPGEGYTKHVITNPDDLTIAHLDAIQPRYIFFPHWSTVIPREIYERYECVVFHETDLPFGRGGSPVQNLIAQGIYHTQITAIRVEAGLDTGPIYLKTPLNLTTGSAAEIFSSISETVFSMINRMLIEEPTPVPQKGTPTVFKRRTPSESEIMPEFSGRMLYDHIRMLDAPEYPHAFMLVGDSTYQFTDARLLANGSVEAKVTITHSREEQNV